MRLCTLVLCVAPPFALGLGLREHALDAAAQDAKAHETAAERRERKVRQGIEEVHARDSIERGLTKSLQAFEGMPGLPKGFGERFKEEFDIDKLLDRTIPSYVKHLNESVVDAAVLFYATEDGKK